MGARATSSSAPRSHTPSASGPPSSLCRMSSGSAESVRLRFIPDMPDLLEFEEPIGELLKEIEALAALEPSHERDKEIARLESRVNVMRGDLYRNLTPWQRVQVA